MNGSARKDVNESKPFNGKPHRLRARLRSCEISSSRPRRSRVEGATWSPGTARIHHRTTQILLPREHMIGRDMAHLVLDAETRRRIALGVEVRESAPSRRLRPEPCRD